MIPDLAEKPLLVRFRKDRDTLLSEFDQIKGNLPDFPDYTE